ncbi:beta-N-acetylhexosaminidase [Halioglobus maricola]|nr:beta-N-acetylhexosaminidase [Halioglobus maricola]
MTTLSICSSKTPENPLVLHLDIQRADNAGRLAFKLHNPMAIPLQQWHLHMDLQRQLTAADGTVLEREGSHLRLRPAQEHVLAPGGHCELALLVAPTALQRHSDLPSGCYLESEGAIYPVTLATHNLPAAKEIPLDSEPVKQLPALATLLPTPRHAVQADAVRHWPEIPVWTGPETCAGALKWVQQMLGQSWRFQHSAEKADLVCSENPGLGPEAFELNTLVSPATLQAADAEGFCRGAATLLQMLHATPGELPALNIEEGPHYSYRGLMLDCARHFHSVETLIDVLDWMALYKLNHFHWHLTDDEAWRLEIPALPELTRVGAWRGHGLTLSPQLGSGPEPYGGSYSRTDVQRVIAAAAQRGITVVPEIDIPGHCRAAIHALPDLLREAEDQSAYESVQFFDDNVLNPALPGTYEFLDKVLKEICTLFPGDKIHMGCDEVPSGAWRHSPACQALMEQEGYTSPTQLQGHLLRYAQDFLAAQGCTLVGWEEAAQGDILPTRTPMCVWSSEEMIQQVAAQGYPVISCAAPRAYLDLAWSDDPAEPGLHWAGTVNLRQSYETPPFPAGMAGGLGVQANLWGELINSREKLEYMLFPRLLATAEWGWCGQAGEAWPEFRARVAAQLETLRGMGLSPRSLDQEP